LPYVYAQAFSTLGPAIVPDFDSTRYI
jgi:hypothetical protein